MTIANRIALTAIAIPLLLGVGTLLTGWLIAAQAFIVANCVMAIWWGVRLWITGSPY